MTIQGAIAELQNLINADDVPFYYKGGIEKVIETIQMEMIDRKTDPTISKMEQVDKDINVRGKDASKVTIGEPFTHIITEDRDTQVLDGWQVKPKTSTTAKDEPQTEPLPKAINGVKIADAVAWADKWLEDNHVSEMWDMIRTLRDATEWQDEPQTERSE